ncbi:MAG: hypothetical protein JXA20_13900 [Spirochaetes bacterium]|nr:hypothetical protein [Spirochaetota bacterium]
MEQGGDGMRKEFATSIGEMERRKRAFRTLAASLMAGATLASLALFRDSILVVLPSLAALAVLLALSDALFRRVFENSKETVVLLTGTTMERRGGRHQALRLADITGVSVKRTSRGSVREVRIDLSGAGPVFINGLHGFEEFRESLLRSLRGGIVPREVREPLDFDHPLFYVLFGGLAGAVPVTAMRLLLQLGEGGGWPWSRPPPAASSPPWACTSSVAGP